MQVLPDQFMHSVWPQGRLGSGTVVGSVWVVLRKEKLLCSPVRAASLSEECCTFYFCPHKTDSSGEKKGALSWMPRRDLTVTLCSTAAGVTPLPIPIPFAPLWDFNFGPNAAGGGADHPPHSRGQVQGPKAWSCIRTPSISPQTHNGYSCYMNVWQIDDSKVVTQN